MKVDISTVIKQDDFIQGFKNGFSQIEAKSGGGTCTKDGEYFNDSVIETFSHYNRDNLLRETVITRSLELKMTTGSVKSVKRMNKAFILKWVWNRITPKTIYGDIELIDQQVYDTLKEMFS